ncbi:MAG: hypothetical protein ACTS6A_01975 [Candidatus Hodgkinia cicadicola]
MKVRYRFGFLRIAGRATLPSRVRTFVEPLANETAGRSLPAH